jgi:hypothetical protein
MDWHAVVIEDILAAVKVEKYGPRSAVGEGL